MRRVRFLTHILGCEAISDRSHYHEGEIVNLTDSAFNAMRERRQEDGRPWFVNTSHAGIVCRNCRIEIAKDMLDTHRKLWHRERPVRIATIVCFRCGRDDFTTERGLGLHTRKRHPEEVQMSGTGPP